MKTFISKIVCLLILSTGVSFVNAQRPNVYDADSAKSVVPYSPLREADVFWSKRIWRVIDMREKINLPFYYPTVAVDGLKSFMQVLLDALKDSSITAFEPGDDQFYIPFSVQQIYASLTDTEHVTLPQTEPPYNMVETTIVKKFDPTTVTKIRLKEDWFFDKQRSVMDVRIIGICPILEEYESDGVTLKGSKPLFWVYFPQARNVFVKAKVFNRFNTVQRLTYDDLFFKRMFGSYIYKESNVYDRTIQEYAKGMDALLESDRIKNDIFLTEHDLWEY